MCREFSFSFLKLEYDWIVVKMRGTMGSIDRFC